MIDFTFNNPQIAAYFNGNDAYIPVAELVYLHEHPLITNQFLRDIEIKIQKCSEALGEKNMKGAVIEKFINHCIAIGTLLPSVNKETAPKLLSELRKVNTLCDKLLKQYNVK